MIKNLDRSGYFGASDTRYVMARNRDTKSWKQWWDVKLGEVEADQISSKEIEAGNKYEHPILTAINEDMILDGQIIHKKYPIRVNYDGYLDGVIYEVKTHHAEKEFEVSTAYWQQAQVEMYVYKEMYEAWFLPPFKQLYIVSYGLYKDEYDVGWNGVEVDPNRARLNLVEYDKSWVKGEYLPKIKELSRALKKGKFPGYFAEMTVKLSSGDLFDIIADFVCVIRAVKDCLEEDYDKEFADEIVTHCGEIAYMSDEEIEEEARKSDSGETTKLEAILEELR